MLRGNSLWSKFIDVRGPRAGDEACRVHGSTLLNPDKTASPVGGFGKKGKLMGEGVITCPGQAGKG